MKVLSFIIAVVVIVGSLFVWIVANYENEKKYDAIVNRAQVAAEAPKMLEYVRMYKQALERNGLTHGHMALIFTKPDNSYAFHFEAVQSIEKRLVRTVEMDPASNEYQTAVDDIRGILRELEFIAKGTTWVQYHWLLWASLLAMLIAFLFGNSSGSGRRRHHSF